VQFCTKPEIERKVGKRLYYLQLTDARNRFSGFAGAKMHQWCKNSPAFPKGISRFLVFCSRGRHPGWRKI